MIEWPVIYTPQWTPREPQLFAGKSLMEHSYREYCNCIKCTKHKIKAPEWREPLKKPCLWHTFWVVRHSTSLNPGHVCYKECGVFYKAYTNNSDRMFQWFTELPVGATLWLDGYKDAYDFFGLELGVDWGPSGVFPGDGQNVSFDSKRIATDDKYWALIDQRRHKFYYVLDYHIANAARELGYQYLIYTSYKTVVQL